MIPLREVIYTGPIDEFFDYRFGRLPYRSLEFKFETRERARRPGGAGRQLSRTRTPYTRVTEFKYLTGQEHPKTTRRLRVSRRPRAIPYYPVPRPENAALYRKYQALADATPDVHFVGRLGTYKYYNMDQVVAQALTLYKKLAGLRRPQPVAQPA